MTRLTLMKRNDWYGLGASLAIHLLLVVLFSVMTLAATDTQPIGFIEVELGPMAEGQPVKRAVKPAPAKEIQPEKPVETEKPAPTPPEKTRPVDLPDQPENIVEEEKIPDSFEETIAPEKKDNPEKVKKAEEPKPKPETIKPLGGGDPVGDGAKESGDQGEGADEKKSSPFQIEGLNRVPVNTTLPVYAAQVNAIIKVRITVDPQGRVIRRIPLIKGNPDLEQSVMDALQRWRFNALPFNAPQENQTGTITFRFQLE